MGATNYNDIQFLIIFLGKVILAVAPVFIFIIVFLVFLDMVRYLFEKIGRILW